MNNYCPHCGTNLDGELIIETFIKSGRSHSEAIEAAKNYAGWSEFGEDNRWCRKIAIYSLEKDRTNKYRCPDCLEEWDR